MSENDYEAKKFAMHVYEEYKELDPNGKVFVVTGENRDVRRSLINDYMEVIVLNEQERNFIINFLGLNKTISRETIPEKQPEQKPAQQTRVQKLVTDLNSKDMSTREAIRTVKPQNKKVKRTLKNRVKKLVKKVYKMIPKTKEEIKEFLKEKCLKIGVGLTALAMMGIIVSETLTNRAENIQRFNSEFTSIEQVETQIKQIIDSEIIEAINHSELEKNDNFTISIDRIEPYREERNKGIRIEINGINANYDKKMVLSEEVFYGGNIPESLEDMAECYLDISEIPNQNIKNRHKNKAIKLLKKVEAIAQKRDFKISKSKVPSIFRSHNSDYVIKGMGERD